MQTTTSANAAHAKRIVLSTFSAGFLGDILCTSVLPRRLTQERGLEVYAVEHPNTRAVFHGNPYVAGFCRGSTVSLDALQNGDGHIIQRLMQGFELPLGIPKPEVHLDPKEQLWADEQRSGWASDRPVCLLSAAAVSDRHNLERVNWRLVCDVLGEFFTIVQPVLNEVPVPGVIAYNGLSVRQYMSLFSVVDFFIGGTSSGSHLAAAFDVPAIIMVWKSLLQKMRFPIVGPVTVSDLDWKAAYLYPHHWFIATDELACANISVRTLRRIIVDGLRHGRAGRPIPIANNARNPHGFAPKPPVRVIKLGSQRLVRLPCQYSM